MIIAEFTVDHPILREPLNGDRAVEIEWEQTFERDGGPTRMLAWVETDDFEAFECAVGRDAGAANPVVVATVERRRLYRFDFTELGRKASLYRRVVSLGGLLKEIVGTAAGWRYRIQVPDRAALDEVCQVCERQGMAYEFQRIFEQRDGGTEAGVALTDAQEEILLAAVESGYLAVPRECSLAELGTRLGISESAASERFRRAAARLVEETLAR
jgi:hypothetical protein